ncbi:MAG TPA: aminomethyl-transferring glycine dehydrogenase subunit GcvPA [Clostridiaceae bacterium]|nr:aminomethyl-transferring glycine dehydrogenase subunit GcvPA [Clostridiaceae bacterium]
MRLGGNAVSVDQTEKVVYPYIPNSAPKIQQEMMDAVGITDLWELYEEVPDELKYKEDLDIPPAILDEFSMKRHIEKILAQNVTCTDYINFLGAGCANHYVPAVVDEITTRGEFLTCYGAESWADHGKYQTFVEYNSMLAELLNTDVMSVPQYDGGQALATAICMANRINGKQRVLLPRSMNVQNKRIVENYIDSVQADLAIEPVYVNYLPDKGTLDLADLKSKLDDSISAVVVESVSYLGTIEPSVKEIGELAKSVGAEYIVYTDPISLGILEAPTNYGATIVCGDLHSLGLHLSCGNGQAGFISTSEDAKYLNEYKDFIYGFCEPEVPGEYVFGNLLIDRTHYSQRAKGKEYTGTGTNLWMISAAVYMALMGPKGFQEIGQTILGHGRYAAKKLSTVPGVQLQFNTPFFKEVVINFTDTNLTVEKINELLLAKGIFGGLDLSHDFPELGQSALYCFTEVTGKEEIDKLVVALKDIMKRG